MLTLLSNVFMWHTINRQPVPFRNIDLWEWTHSDIDSTLFIHWCLLHVRWSFLTKKNTFYQHFPICSIFRKLLPVPLQMPYPFHFRFDKCHKNQSLHLTCQWWVFHKWPNVPLHKDAWQHTQALVIKMSVVHELRNRCNCQQRFLIWWGWLLINGINVPVNSQYSVPSIKYNIYQKLQ